MNPSPTLPVPDQIRWLAARVASNVTDEQMPPERRFAEPYLTVRRAIFGHNGGAAEKVQEALVDYPRGVEVAENILRCDPTPPTPPFQLVTMKGMWKDQQAVRHLWPGWMLAGQITLIGGVSNVGKSPLLLAIVAGYLRGTWPDGSPVPDFARGRPVVYCIPEGYGEQTMLLLDWGMDEDEVERRVFIPSIPTPGAPEIATYTFKLDTQPGLDALRYVCEVVKPGLIVVDGLRAAMSGEESASGDVDKFYAPFVALAGQHDATVIMTHHLTKGAEDRSREGASPSMDWLRGSSHLAAIPRSIWIVDRPNPDKPEERRITLVKAAGGPQGVTMGWAMGDPVAGIRWLGAPPVPAARNKKEAVQRLVLELLEDGERTREEIAREVHGALEEVSDATIREALRELTSQHRAVTFKLPGVGGAWGYRLAGPPPPIPPEDDFIF